MRRSRLGRVRVTVMPRGPPSATLCPNCSSRTGSAATATCPPHGVSCGLRSRLLIAGCYVAAAVEADASVRPRC